MTPVPKFDSERSEEAISVSAISNMQFEYEITADEYVAAQLLHYRQAGGRKRIHSAITWILVGLFFLVVSWNERALKWTPILLAGVGIWWVYAGLRSLFPARYFRSSYLQAEVAGRKFRAEVNEEGFEVTGDCCSWRVRWPGVRVKGEDSQVFIFFAEGTIFIFGRKYMTTDQQEQLRKLSGL